ncbi:MAG: hypothetical protein ACLP6E_11385 [Acidimicrobiales bacterium]
MNAPDRESAKDRLLDLFVFAPVGIALTLVEELPSLVEKGRNRIEGRSATARVVGQFAVQLGSREVTRRVRQVLEPEPAKPAKPAKPARPPRPQSSAHKAVTTEPHEPHRHDAIHATSHLEEHREPTRSVNGLAARGDLAIPAYDTLSASQVVKLLAGLSDEELIEVRAHELSNRHRATILNRVEQLLSGEPSLETP